MQKLREVEPLAAVPKSVSLGEGDISTPRHAVVRLP